MDHVWKGCLKVGVAWVKNYAESEKITPVLNSTIYLSDHSITLFPDRGRDVERC